MTRVSNAPTAPDGENENWETLWQTLPQLREVLPAGRERAGTVIQYLQDLVEKHPDEFPDGAVSALGAMDWLRKLLNAEYDAAEEGEGK